MEFVIVFLSILIALLIISSYENNKHCRICGENESDKLVGIDYNSSACAAYIRIQKQKIYKADCRVCKLCFKGLTLLGSNSNLD